VEHVKEEEEETSTAIGAEEPHANPSGFVDESTSTLIRAF